MRATLIMYTVYGVVAGGVIFAIAAGMWEARHDRLFREDFGAIVLAPIVFILIGQFRNEMGWALIIWPIVAAVLFMYSYGVKVTLIDRYFPNPHRNSKYLFYLALGGVVVAALTVPPWYE